MQIIVDDLMVNYEKTSKKTGQSGPVLLWLHGWGDNIASSAAIRAEVAKKYTVLAVDLPGFGGTQAPKLAWGLDEYAQFTAHFLSKMNTQIDVLLGHSNGGAIAIRGLSNGTLTAQSLVLLASAGIRDTYNGRKKVLRLAAKSAKFITKPLPGSIQQKIKAKAYSTIGSDMLVTEHMQETFKKIVTDDVQADTRKVTVPSLLIYGYDDTATPVHYGELLQAGLEHSELHVVPHAGHFVYLDKPRVVQDLIEKFLV